MRRLNSSLALALEGANDHVDRVENSIDSMASHSRIGVA